MYEHVRDLYDNIIVRLLRQGWEGPKGSRRISRYNHSLIFNGDNIIGDESNNVGIKPFKQTNDGVKPNNQTTDKVKPNNQIH